MKLPSASSDPAVQYCHKAAFLDRDGVINVDYGYVSRWEDFEFLPGAIEGMRLLQDAGYKLVIITNQSGIARGYFGEGDYQELTAAYDDFLSRQGVTLSGIYHCPHHPDYPAVDQPSPCNCRKPAPGLLLQAINELKINPRESALFGDSARDLQAGDKASVGKLYLIGSSPAFLRNAVHVTAPWSASPSLLEAVKQLLL